MFFQEELASLLSVESHFLAIYNAKKWKFSDLCEPWLQYWL